MLNGSSSRMLKQAINCVLGLHDILNVAQEATPAVRASPAALLTGSFEHPVIR